MRYLFGVSFLFLSFTATAQKIKTDSSQLNWVYNCEASFTGGFDALKKFISRHIIIPDSLPFFSFTKKGLIQFTVKEDGSTASFKILEKVGYGYDEAIIAALKLTQWFPAKENGIAIDRILKVNYTSINN